jgi:hypothetical protein
MTAIALEAVIEMARNSPPISAASRPEVIVNLRYSTILLAFFG